MLQYAEEHEEHEEHQEENNLWNRVLSFFDDLDEDDDDESSPFESFIYLIRETNILTMRQEIDLQDYEFVMVNLVEDYNDFIQVLHKKYNSVNTEEYLIPEVVLREQNERIKHELNKLSLKYKYQVNSLIQLMSQYQEKSSQILELIKGGKHEGIAEVAKNIGGGALAVANPLIGVPFLVGNYFHGKDKEKREDTQFDSFLKLHDKIISVIEESYSDYLDLVEEQKMFVIKNLVNPILKELEEIFINLEKEGESLLSLEELMSSAK